MCPIKINECFHSWTNKADESWKPHDARCVAHPGYARAWRLSHFVFCKWGKLRQEPVWIPERDLPKVACRLFYSGRAVLQRVGEKPRLCSMAGPSPASKLTVFPAESFLHSMACCRESYCIIPLCMLPLLTGILSCFFPHSQHPLTHHSLITRSC